MSKILVKQTGMLRRADNMPFTPEISPDIQGQRAYDLLTEEQKGHLKAALSNATTNPKSKLYGCKVEDLEWSFGKGHPVQPIRIRKKKRI